MELNKSNVKKILGIIFASILFLVALENFSGVTTFLTGAVRLFLPFLVGAGAAFIINVPMRAIENLLFSRFIRSDKPFVNRIKRPISLLLAILFLALIFAAVAFIVAPEIIQTVDILKENIPNFVKRISKEINNFSTNFPEIAAYFPDMTIDWNQITQKLLSFIQSIGTTILNSSFSFLLSFVNGIVGAVLGTVFCILILAQKEKLARQMRQLLYSFLPTEKVDRFLSIARLSNKTFSKFISGQCLEALILGALLFISMSIFRFPYALMISVLVAFTALIPIFGAIIGGVVGSFLILIVNPLQALWFIIMFIIVQQIEGNLIYPYVVGNSIGLPAMWVLVAVSLGGSLMGIPGMLIFVPASSVLYALMRETVYKRLQERKIPPEKCAPAASLSRKE